MAQWEYLTRIFTLDKEDEVVIDYVQAEYPDRNWKELGKHDPLALEAWLNQCGGEGWELITLVPAETQGKQGDLGRGYNYANWNWAHYYLCVFKRRVEKGHGSTD